MNRTKREEYFYSHTLETELQTWPSQDGLLRWKEPRMKLKYINVKKMVGGHRILKTKLP